MFGHYYARRDNDLQEKKSNQEDYAIELLTELLNRAQLLEPIFLRCVEADGADQRGYLEELAFAVDVFLLDVHEAAERGARASLYAVSSFGVLDDAAAGSGDLVPEGR